MAKSKTKSKKSAAKNSQHSKHSAKKPPSHSTNKQKHDEDLEFARAQSSLREREASAFLKKEQRRYRVPKTSTNSIINNLLHHQSLGVDKTTTSDKVANVMHTVTTLNGLGASAAIPAANDSQVPNPSAVKRKTAAPANSFSLLEDSSDDSDGGAANPPKPDFFNFNPSKLHAIHGNDDDEDL